MTSDLKTADFDFVLPQDRIAQEPVIPRDSARLLFCGSGGMADKRVCDLPDLLRQDDLLVVNDTKVIPARLFGLRGVAKVELFLLKRIGGLCWRTLARPGKRLRVGDEIVVAPDFIAKILCKHESGEVDIEFCGDIKDFTEKLMRYGQTPLPPYIQRKDGARAEDKNLYQTIYAKHEGAVAAPTAGLHFTPELFDRLHANGVDDVKLTLHVGAGTFQPVKAEYLRDHVMHSEGGTLTLDAANKINQAKKDGRRIVAVGTTSLRLLESAAGDDGLVKPFCGDTNIFIYPGYKFKIVDVLMTNFHLPQSTLFMLVCAFAGYEEMHYAYRHAIGAGYRFYSYGDACLLERRI